MGGKKLYIVALTMSNVSKLVWLYQVPARGGDGSRVEQYDQDICLQCYQREHCLCFRLLDSTSVDEHGEADWVWGKAQERCAASLTQQALGVDGITIRSHRGHKLFLYTDEKWSFHLRRALVVSMFTLDWWGKCSDVLFGYEISFNPWRPQSS